MIGDSLTYFETYQQITNHVMQTLHDLLKDKKRICIAVAGESGCGKTSLAYALAKDLEIKLGIKGYIFHGDDYFKLPPASNHQKRLEDISWVGPQEVNLDHLDKDVQSFKANKDSVIKPLVNYKENRITSEIINPNSFDFCIVEGTYATLLEQADYKIFIKTTYIETLMARQARARDVMNAFNEKVLEIEHQIISAHAEHADLKVEQDLSFSTN